MTYLLLDEPEMNRKINNNHAIYLVRIVVALTIKLLPITYT